MCGIRKPAVLENEAPRVGIPHTAGKHIVAAAVYTTDEVRAENAVNCLCILTSVVKVASRIVVVVNPKNREIII